MANYKESQVTGTQWTRCNLVTIENRLGSAPTVQFQEESVISTPTGTVALPTQGLRLTSVVNPANEIELIDPNTGEATGEKITEGYLYAALFSKYMALAKDRDRLSAMMHMPPPIPTAVTPSAPAPAPAPTPTPTPAPEPAPTPTPEA